jgi:hypothetical protein
MGRLIAPDTNPVKFVKKDFSSTDTQRLSGSYNFVDTIKSFDFATFYNQKWVVGDLINLQFLKDDLNTLEIKLLKCTGESVATLSVANTITGLLVYNFYYDVVQYSYDTTGLPAGQYYLQIRFREGVSTTDQYLISEPQEIVDSINESVLLEYTNLFNDFDTVFATDVDPSWEQIFYFRVEGSIINGVPKVIEESYEDQLLTKKLLSAKPYSEYVLSIGGNRGVPEWVGFLLNMIRSCNLVKNDSIQYIFEGDIERKQVLLYPLFGFTSKIRTVIVDYSNEFGTPVSTLTCNVPGTPVASSITSSSAVLTWTISGYNGYGFAWNLYIDDGVTLTPLSNGSTFALNYTATGLSSGIQYRFVVKSICTGGTYSGDADVLFTTL